MSTHDGLGINRDRDAFAERIVGGRLERLERVSPEQLRAPHPPIFGRRPFPVDPRSLSRDELLRRQYARRYVRTRAEFVRRLAEAHDRLPWPPLALSPGRGLLQTAPRFYAPTTDAKTTVRRFLADGFGPDPRPGTRIRVLDAPAPRDPAAARRASLAIAAAFLETHPTPEQLLEFAEGYASQVRP